MQAKNWSSGTMRNQLKSSSSSVFTIVHRFITRNIPGVTQEPLDECAIQRKIKSQVGYLRYIMRKHRMTSDLSNSTLHDDVNWRPRYHWGFWDASLCQQALGQCRRAEKAYASAVKKRVSEKQWEEPVSIFTNTTARTLPRPLPEKPFLVSERQTLKCHNVPCEKISNVR